MKKQKFGALVMLAVWFVVGCGKKAPQDGAEKDRASQDLFEALSERPLKKLKLVKSIKAVKGVPVEINGNIQYSYGFQIEQDGLRVGLRKEALVSTSEAFDSLPATLDLGPVTETIKFLELEMPDSEINITTRENRFKIGIHFSREAPVTVGQFEELGILQLVSE